MRLAGDGRTATLSIVTLPATAAGPIAPANVAARQIVEVGPARFVSAWSADCIGRVVDFPTDNRNRSKP